MTSYSNFKEDVILDRFRDAIGLPIACFLLEIELWNHLIGLLKFQNEDHLHLGHKLDEKYLLKIVKSLLVILG